MKRSNKIAFGILGVVGIIFLALLVTGFIAKKKIENNIEAEFGNQFTWEELDVKIFRRSISFQNTNLQLDAAGIKADAILLNNINYFKIFFGDEIRIGTLEITNPAIEVNENQEENQVGEEERPVLEQKVSIGSLKIFNGSLLVKGEERERHKLSFVINEMVLQDIHIDSTSLKEKVPFKHGAYEFALDSVGFAMDEQHDLILGTFNSTGGNLQMEQVRIIPRYDKVEFQKHIPHEKDRVELELEAVQIEDFKWSFEEDSLLLSSSKLTLENADLEIYRSKLLPEDPRKKPLYSESLRKLPVKLHFPRVEVSSSRIAYEEKSTAGRPPGRVHFTEVEGSIENLTNTGMGEEDFPVTVIHAEALFYGQSPVQLDWEFDVRNTREEFTVSGRLSGVTAEGINAFIRPAMNVEARGGIDLFAFNFAGNDDNARGDVVTRYEDFKINILKDDGSEKNSFWSAIANLFISNDAVTENVEHNDLSVTRDKNKSFWNFLWLCVREGALSSFL